MGNIRFWFLFVAFAVFAPTYSRAGIFVSVGFAPPPLPIYEQPFCPGPDFMWTPGYWAYDQDIEDYYWVPGEWVRAPAVGYLWTPGYWGWGDGLYVWHAGYWGPHVGYYGGIDYGFGYGGHGYYGGHWDHETFVYNTAVTRINTTIVHNTYNETVIVDHDHTNRVSFNGGPGGVLAKPTAEDRAAAAEHHVPWTRIQTENHISASKQKDMRASINHGTPTLAAVSHSPSFNNGQDNASQYTPEKHKQIHGDRFSAIAPQPSNHVKPQGGEANAFAHDPRGRMMGADDRVPRGPSSFHNHEEHRDKKEPKQGAYR
jgi:hypothetical protein